METIKNKIILVTGASRGIGKAIAMEFARYGANIIVNYHTSHMQAMEICAKIDNDGGKSLAIRANVSNPNDVRDMFSEIKTKFGGLDILVNNAGILRDRMVYNMTPEEWDMVIKVHLYGTFYCTRYASAHMREQRYGRIINTSSHSGLGNMGQSNYSAAKEGIVGFTRTVAKDLARYGVTCNAIRPRAGTRLTVNPALKEAWVKMMGEERAKEHVKELEEVILPEEIAPLIVYLATEAAGEFNGCVFEVWKGHVGIYEDPPRVEQVLWKDGSWDPEELVRVMPNMLAQDKVLP